MEHTKLSQKGGIYDKLVYALLPMAFIGSGYTNTLAYVLGLHQFDLIRKIFTFGILAFSGIVFLFKIVLLWKQRAETRKAILYTSIIPVLFGGLYLWALLIQSDKFTVLKSAIIEGGYLVLLCSAFLILFLEKKLRLFLRICKIYSLLIAPVMLYYCIRFYLPSATSGVEDLGSICYLTLAVMLLYLCEALAIEILLYPPEIKIDSPYLSVALFVLFSIGITLSQTKGAMIRLAFLTIVSYGYCILVQKSARKVHTYGIASLAVLILFSTALFPSYGGENRVAVFLRDLTNGSTITTNEIQDAAKGTNQIASAQDPEVSDDPAVSDDPEDPVTPDEPETPETPDTSGDSEISEDNESMQLFDTVNFYYSGQADIALDSGRITQSQYDAIEDMAYKINSTSTGARTFLWLSAITEIKSAPLTGHGPFSFIAKYETSPHNLYLDIAADLGIPVLILVLLLGLYTFIRMICLSKTNTGIAAFTLVIFTFLPQTMVGTGMLDGQTFAQLGFCVCLVFGYHAFYVDKALPVKK